VINKIKTFLRDQDGLTIVEYAVAGGLIAAAVALAFQTLGVSVGAVISLINGYL
jgi:pilus assembly protein Flp/PilA